MIKELKMIFRICSIPNCNEKHEAKGYCRHHYNQIYMKTYIRPESSKLCTVEHCNNKQKGKGLCAKHYNRLYRNGGVNKLKKQRCQVDGCEIYTVGRGYCSLHYHRYIKWGDPLKTYKDFLKKKKCHVSYCNARPNYGGYCQFHEKIIRPFDPFCLASIEDIYGLPPYHCYLCGTKYPELSSKYFQLDHLIPRSRGGNGDKENLKIACIRCNQTKRNLTPKEFIEMCHQVSKFNS